MASATTPAPEISLRERKKIRTRQAIRNAAGRLFAEQGYDDTTVEQIAAAAEVSPSTFFRYFPTKEDVVLTDEYDELVVAAIEKRPADESVVQSMRVVTGAMLRQMFEEEPEAAMQRMRLARDVPAIRSRMGDTLGNAAELLVEAFARRSGRPTDDFELRVLVAALLGGWHEAMIHWVDTGGREPLADLLDRTLTLMVDGLAGRI